MGKISDQLREWTRRARADEHMSLRELDAIADRIDAEMVELPRDIDGVPINLGDTVYLYVAAPVLPNALAIMQQV